MRIPTKLVAILAPFGLLAACGGGAQETTGANTTTHAAMTGDQVTRGQGLFADNCAKCHGMSGEGKGKAPALVGKGALPLDPRPGSKRTVQFRTVADVGGWVKANMPPMAPGSLTDDEYWAILAFDLKANGIDLGGKTLDGALATTLVIPR